jgi:hypothetical protein
MLNVTKRSDETVTEDETEKAAEALFLEYRIGITVDTDDESKIDFIMKVMRSAAELIAADHKDITLDVSSYSGSSAPVRIPLARKRM